MKQNPQNFIDWLCALPGIGGVACFRVVDALPILLQVLSIISVCFSIAWFVYRFYKSSKKK